MDLKKFEVWFVTGSQHLYGEETLRQVAEHSKTIAKALNEAPQIPVKVVFKPTVKTPDEIYHICVEAKPAPAPEVKPAPEVTDGWAAKSAPGHQGGLFSESDPRIASSRGGFGFRVWA